MTDQKNESHEMRVAGDTPSKLLADSITSHIREGKDVTLVCIGHQAVGQAVKAVPIVNSHLVQKGWLYSIFPAFTERTIKDEQTGAQVKRTAMLLHLVRYQPR